MISERMRLKNGRLNVILEQNSPTGDRLAAGDTTGLASTIYYLI